MHKLNGLYKRGINLAVWLSQHTIISPDANPAHFDNFIMEKDIAQIASRDLHHVHG